MHLIVEASDRRTLSRSLQGLFIRVARAVNRAWQREGPIFSDRYHDRILRTPTEVRNALEYVLNNAKRHGIYEAGVDVAPDGRLAQAGTDLGRDRTEGLSHRGEAPAGILQPPCRA